MKLREKKVTRMCHQALMENPDEALESYHYINQQQITNGILYNDKPLPTLLEPGFISVEEVKKINDLVFVIEKGIESIISVVLDKEDDKSPQKDFLRDEVKRIMALSDLEREIMSIRCGINKSLFIHRLDLYYDEEKGFQILEFNTDSPGGYVDADTQCKIFLEVPHMKRLDTQFNLHGSNITRDFFTIIRNIHNHHSMDHRAHVCIAGLREDTSRTEHAAIAKFFNDWGLPALLADPREIRYLNGSLYVKNDRIDFVYRRLILFELIEKRNEVKDFILGIRDSDIPVLNPFRSAIGSNKSILAILSDEHYHSLFDEEVVSVIDKYLPWTRPFDPNTDNTVIEMALEERERFVLKKSVSYGGAHVVVGKAVSDDHWKNAIEQILSQKEKWIIQEYIDKTVKRYPYVSDKGLGFRDMVLNLNPFIVDGRYAGGMIRVSPADEYVINVGKGGAQIPMFVYKGS